MEIVSYVLAGELAHKDSMGNGSTIRPGDVQRMSAGSGVRHSEFNPSEAEGTHFLQIWIQPRQQNIAPSYEEKHFAAGEKRGRLRLIVSPDRASGSLLIHQDARIYAGLFDGTEQADLAIEPGRSVYVHVARGALTVNGEALRAGDALSSRDASSAYRERPGRRSPGLRPPRHHPLTTNWRSPPPPRLSSLGGGVLFDARPPSAILWHSPRQSAWSRGIKGPATR
jgi:redox-sensitive bicupin YhaK (pirin superfamily)